MSEKPQKKYYTLICGGCYQRFFGIKASELLDQHIKDDPCEHYRSKQRNVKEAPKSEA